MNRRSFFTSAVALACAAPMAAIAKIAPMPFASGGYAPLSMPYTIGERGAELFVPRVAGAMASGEIVDRWEETATQRARRLRIVELAP